MSQLTRSQARKIVEIVGGNGIPPEGGFDYFSSGIDDYISLFSEEYLDDYIQSGGSTFKLLVGAYGGGKTHFLYTLREQAWKRNYVVSYVPLSASETPFSKLELIYRSIVRTITTPKSIDETLEGYERGARALLCDGLAHFHPEERVPRDKSTVTLEQRLSEIENSNFAHAVSTFFKAHVANQPEVMSDVIQWINGEGYDPHIHKQYKILNPITRGNAFSMIRSLVTLIRSFAYAGLVILFDEAESIPSLSTREKDLMLSNLREIIDSCAETHFGSVMIVYAVPDENFLEGKTHVYEALKQRTQTVFTFVNPSGVRILLENLSQDPLRLLCEIGQKLGKIYATAYGMQFDNTLVDALVSGLSEMAYQQRFGDIGYKRLFVQAVVRGFHFLRLKRPDRIDGEVLSDIFQG